VHELGRDQSDTTKELRDITTRHASGEEAAMTVFVLGDRKMVPSNSWATPSKATSKGTMKGAKGDKKGQNQRPRWVAVTTSGNNGNKEANGSDEEYVTSVKHNFKG
jgi:hypothetical protein